MPIYEYRCAGCAHEFECLQKISDPPVQLCPECGESEVRKLVSQSGFVLKGGGWYKDHYGLKSASTSEDSGTSEPSTSPSESSASSSESESSTASSE